MSKENLDEQPKSNPTVLAEMRYVYHDDETHPYVTILGIDFDGAVYKICTMTMVNITERTAADLYKCCLETFHDLGYCLAKEYKSK